MSHFGGCASGNLDFAYFIKLLVLQNETFLIYFKHCESIGIYPWTLRTKDSTLRVVLTVSKLDFWGTP